MSSDGGKGSGRRPQVVVDDVVANNWAKIFAKNPDNTGISVSDYHDNIDSEQDKVSRNNTETQEVKR